MSKKLNANLINIITQLADGEHHDGSAMGETLGMTRSAVWKIIKKLQAYGVAIESVKGKGYALREPLVLLDERKIKSKLSAEKISLAVFASIHSTNKYLRQKKPYGGLEFCLAEEQTEGRGRLQREWYSPFGKNIYLSCLYPFRKDISELSGLSLVTSLAILATLKSVGINEHIQVKWPNDILCENKKISGSLIEIQAESHGSCHAIIGIGINVNMLADADVIAQPWTSIRQVLGKYIDRNELCVHLINHLVTYLREFEAHGFTRFVAEWMNSDCLMRQSIEIKNLNHKIGGTVVGVNEYGHLLLQLADGKVKAFSAGDTTIMKKPAV